MDQQQRNGRWRDPRNAAGLPQRFGPVLLQFLAHLKRQRGNLHVLQVSWQPQVFIIGRPLHFFALAVDVPRVFGGNFPLLHDRVVQVVERFT